MHVAHVCAAAIYRQLSRIFKEQSLGHTQLCKTCTAWGHLVGQKLCEVCAKLACSAGQKKLWWVFVVCFGSAGWIFNSATHRSEFGLFKKKIFFSTRNSFQGIWGHVLFSAWVTSPCFSCACVCLKLCPKRGYVDFGSLDGGYKPKVYGLEIALALWEEKTFVGWITVKNVALICILFFFSEAIAAPAGDCNVISLGPIPWNCESAITLELPRIVNLLRHRITENPSFFL